MFHRFVLSISVCVCFVSVIGCGGSNTAEYDVNSAPPVTAEEIKAQEDYEAQRKKEQQEMYGK